MILGTFSNLLNAQNCTAEELAKKLGSYKDRNGGGSTLGVAAADLAREKMILTNVHKMVAAKYVPVGVEAQYSSHFGYGMPLPGVVKIADSFGYSIYLKKYYCDKQSADKSKYYPAGETGTILSIDVNVINRYKLSASDIADNSFRGYLLLKEKPQKINGFYYLGNEFTGDTRAARKYYTWLVTYDDTLPFIYFTRKEYLLLSKARLAKTISQYGSDSGYFTEFVNRINDALKRPESELNQEAIVNGSDEEKFTGFVEESDPYARHPVKHNTAYYRKGLPKSAPQFISVVFSVMEDNESAVYVANMNENKKVVDFNVLRNMLGK